MKEIVFAGGSVGPNQPPFIIAEMSANHNGSLERALKIVDAAAQAGVHAIKLQTYTADTMTLNIQEREFFIDAPDSLWKGRSLYDLYQDAHTPWEWHEPIFKRCREHGIIGFSTPFDPTAVDFLEALEVPLYKVASFEILDLPLIKKIAKTGKPMILSTGMSNLSEIEDAVRCARENGCKDIVLLKCTSSYPASPCDSNLLSIPKLKEAFDVQVGLSDHTLGIGSAIASVALGATVIEKHFTLDRSEGGVDGSFSMNVAEMKSLVTESKSAWQALGKVEFGCSDAEKKSIQFRRSLYVVKEMRAGETFTLENLRPIRPGYGLAPKHLDAFIGKKVRKDIPRGTPLSWDLLEQ